MNNILRTFYRFGSLNTQFLRNKSKNAVRFESQNIIWDFEEVNYQSTAFSKGLLSLNFQKNDNILIRVPSSQQSEAYIAKLGTAAINANLIISKARTIHEAEEEIRSNNIKGIIFEPTTTVGTEQYIDVLNTIVPELSKTANGARVKSTKYPTLSAFIQTNFYSYPGVFKFRSILNYADDKYFKLPEITDYQAITLPESSNTIVITQPAHDFAFRAGILNSNINGRHVVVAEPRFVNKIASNYQGKIDLIATEPITVSLDSSINVFVEKGSDILKEHTGSRTEL